MSRLRYVFLAIVTMSSICSSARADSTHKNYGTAWSPVTIAEYSRISSLQNVLGRSPSVKSIVECNQPGVICEDFRTTTQPLATAIHCDGKAGTNGGWVANTAAATGRCFNSVLISYDVDGDKIYAGTVSGSSATLKFDFTPKSYCPGGVPYDAGKNACAFNWQGSGIHTDNVVTNTNDDMFGIVSTTSGLAKKYDNDVGAFFEYPRLAASPSDLSSDYRLQYIIRTSVGLERYPSRTMMMPSGPANFNDFRNFIDKAKTSQIKGVKVEGACYPVTVAVCDPVHIVLPGVAGRCGSSNGGSFATQPSAGLCAFGNGVAMAGNGPWSWQCPGLHGGGNATCSAKLRINGTCGGANNVFSLNAPGGNLCAAGTAAGMHNGNPNWAWSCVGQNGGSTASCSAPNSVDGQCGPANNTTASTAPSSGLCNAGDPTSVAGSGSGPYTWNCNGKNSGQTASCSTKAVNLCGSANGGTSSYIALTEYITRNPTLLCSSGMPSAIGGNTSGSRNFTWTCSDGSASSSCHAGLGTSSTNGACYITGYSHPDGNPMYSAGCNSGTGSTSGGRGGIGSNNSSGSEGHSVQGGTGMGGGGSNGSNGP